MIEERSIGNIQFAIQSVIIKANYLCNSSGKSINFSVFFLLLEQCSKLCAIFVIICMTKRVKWGQRWFLFHVVNKLVAPLINSRHSGMTNCVYTFNELLARHVQCMFELCFTRRCYMTLEVVMLKKKLRSLDCVSLFVQKQVKETHTVIGSQQCHRL